MQGVNWYDIVVAVAVLYGLWAGLRSGLTGEIIGVLGLVLMITLSLQFHTDVGPVLQRFMGWSDAELANLVAFAGIAVLVYVVTILVKRSVHESVLKMKLASIVENVGGAFAGMVRMLVVMILTTVVAGLTRSPWLHRHIATESRFGSYVVERLPVVKAVVEKNYPETLWPLGDIKRREEPKIDEGESKKSR